MQLNLDLYPVRQQIGTKTRCTTRTAMRLARLLVSDPTTHRAHRINVFHGDGIEPGLVDGLLFCRPKRRKREVVNA